MIVDNLLKLVLHKKDLQVYLSLDEFMKNRYIYIVEWERKNSLEKSTKTYI